MEKYSWFFAPLKRRFLGHFGAVLEVRVRGRLGARVRWCDARTRAGSLRLCHGGGGGQKVRRLAGKTASHHSYEKFSQRGVWMGLLHMQSKSHPSGRLGGWVAENYRARMTKRSARTSIAKTTMSATVADFFVQYHFIKPPFRSNYGKSLNTDSEQG